MVVLCILLDVQIAAKYSFLQDINRTLIFLLLYCLIVSLSHCLIVSLPVGHWSNRAMENNQI